jgi:two-component system sensor histidine kinase ComP
MTNNQPVIPEHSNIRIKKTIIFILAFILIGVSCLYFSFSIGKPIMGIDLEFINGSWTVSSEDPNGIAPRAGIKIGDVAVSVNGQPADEYLSEEEVIYGRNIQQIEITDSTGSLQSISLQDYTQPWQNKLEIIILFLTCVIFWATGLFVFAKIPHKQPATLLLLTSLVFGLTVCANMALERYASIAASQIGAIGAIIGPWLLFHFFLVLPEERTGIRNNHLTYLIYLPAVVLSLLFVLIGFENGQAIPSFRTVRLIAIVLGFLAVLTVVIFNFRRAVSPRTRQQMKIIAISCLIAVVPFLIIYLIPHMIFHQYYSGRLSAFFPVLYSCRHGYAVITQNYWI